MFILVYFPEIMHLILCTNGYKIHSTVIFMPLSTGGWNPIFVLEFCGSHKYQLIVYVKFNIWYFILFNNCCYFPIWLAYAAKKIVLLPLSKFTI